MMLKVGEVVAPGRLVVINVVLDAVQLAAVVVREVQLHPGAQVVLVVVGQGVLVIVGIVVTHHVKEAQPLQDVLIVVEIVRVLVIHHARADVIGLVEQRVRVNAVVLHVLQRVPILVIEDFVMEVAQVHAKLLVLGAVLQLVEERVK